MTYMGVEHLSVYHGQTVRNFNVPGRWPRVDNRDRDPRTGGLNARDGLDCADVSSGSLWWVGRPRDTGDLEDLDAWEIAFQTWSEDLFSAGYVATPGLSLLMPNSGTVGNGQIDPSNPGQLVVPGGTSSAANGGDPYEVNWVVINGQITFLPPTL